MHILHFGVVITAPDYLTPDRAQELLAETLADAKAMGQDRLKLGAIDDQATLLTFSDFLVTEESPAKLRLDWMIRHPDLRIQGNDRSGWLIFDAGAADEYAAGPTAYAAIDAAIARELKGN